MIEKYFTSRYLNGQKLVGDDFSPQQIKQWYREEEEAYSALIGQEYSGYLYENINNYYGLKKLIAENNRVSMRILCFGAAYGGEIFALEKLLKMNQISEYKIIVIDASDEMLNHIGKELEYIEVLKANMDGTIDIEDASIDLITCFGVLHHIPNVTFILSEFERVLTESGTAFIREPISSMGDWRTLRNGCTINERGIAPEYFQKICHQNRLYIFKQQYAFFPPLIQIGKRINMEIDSLLMIVVDRLVSLLFAWNVKYYRQTLFDKFGPSSCYWTIKRVKR